MFQHLGREFRLGSAIKRPLPAISRAGCGGCMRPRGRCAMAMRRTIRGCGRAGTMPMALHDHRAGACPARGRRAFFVGHNVDIPKLSVCIEDPCQ
jgi:hypothetical protein